MDNISRHLTYPIVVCTVDITGHTEVPDLDDVFVAHETVPGGQVPVDEVLGGEVLHTRGHMAGDTEELLSGQRRYWLTRSHVKTILSQICSIRTVRSEMLTNKYYK